MYSTLFKELLVNICETTRLNQMHQEHPRQHQHQPQQPQQPSQTSSIQTLSSPQSDEVWVDQHLLDEHQQQGQQQQQQQQQQQGQQQQPVDVAEDKTVDEDVNEPAAEAPTYAPKVIISDEKLPKPVDDNDADDDDDDDGDDSKNSSSSRVDDAVQSSSSSDTVARNACDAVVVVDDCISDYDPQIKTSTEAGSTGRITFTTTSAPHDTPVQQIDDEQRLVLLENIAGRKLSNPSFKDSSFEILNFEPKEYAEDVHLSNDLALISQLTSEYWTQLRFQQTHSAVLTKDASTVSPENIAHRSITKNSEETNRECSEFQSVIPLAMDGVMMVAAAADTGIDHQQQAERYKIGQESTSTEAGQEAADKDETSGDSPLNPFAVAAIDGKLTEFPGTYRRASLDYLDCGTGSGTDHIHPSHQQLLGARSKMDVITRRASIAATSEMLLAGRALKDRAQRQMLDFTCLKEKLEKLTGTTVEGKVVHSVGARNRDGRRTGLTLVKHSTPLTMSVMTADGQTAPSHGNVDTREDLLHDSDNHETAMDAGGITSRCDLSSSIVTSLGTQVIKEDQDDPGTPVGLSPPWHQSGCSTINESNDINISRTNVDTVVLDNVQEAGDRESPVHCNLCGLKQIRPYVPNYFGLTDLVEARKHEPGLKAILARQAAEMEAIRQRHMAERCLQEQMRRRLLPTGCNASPGQESSNIPASPKRVPLENILQTPGVPCTVAPCNQMEQTGNAESGSGIQDNPGVQSVNIPQNPPIPCNRVSTERQSTPVNKDASVLAGAVGTFKRSSDGTVFMRAPGFNGTQLNDMYIYPAGTPISPQTFVNPAQPASGVILPGPAASVFEPNQFIVFQPGSNQLPTLDPAQLHFVENSSTPDAPNVQLQMQNEFYRLLALQQEQILLEQLHRIQQRQPQVSLLQQQQQNVPSQMPYRNPGQSIGEISFQNPGSEIGQMSHQNERPDIGHAFYPNPESDISQMLHQNPGPSIGQMLYQNLGPGMVLPDPHIPQLQGPYRNQYGIIPQVSNLSPQFFNPLAPLNSTLVSEFLAMCNATMMSGQFPALPNNIPQSQSVPQPHAYPYNNLPPVPGSAFRPYTIDSPIPLQSHGLLSVARADTDHPSDPTSISSQPGVGMSSDCPPNPSRDFPDSTGLPNTFDCSTDTASDVGDEIVHASPAPFAPGDIHSSSAASTVVKSSLEMNIAQISAPICLDDAAVSSEITCSTMLPVMSSILPVMPSILPVMSSILPVMSSNSTVTSAADSPLLEVQTVDATTSRV